MGNSKKYFEADDDEVLSAEILEFAHEYQSNDFPNPHRKNCLSKEDLLKIANSGELPKAELREHLFICSPCFLEFHAAKQAKITAPLPDKITSAEQKSSWLGFFLRPLPVIVATAVLLCAITGIILYKQHDPNIQTSTEIAEEKKLDEPKQTFNAPKPANLSTENNETIATKTPKQTDPITSIKNKTSKNNSENDPKDESKLSAQNTINLDLGRAAVLRNENSRETVYSLPPQNVALNVKLPEGSPAGNYDISLLDEFGKPLLKDATLKSDGKKLAVKLDLQKMRGRARLCIAPKGEIPDCFAVKIGRAE